jgi:uncharacterized membrane protein YkgB
MKKIKPQLVDKELLKPKKKILPKIEINNDNNLRMYINIIGIIIVVIFFMILYGRYKNKEKIELENQNRLINLHMYVNEKIKNN